MRTLCAMVSIGNREQVLPRSYPRFWSWCNRWSYDCILVKQPLHVAQKRPHFTKLHIPNAYQGYDRYLICDDDILISARAPQLPEVPDGFIGLVPDVVQDKTEHPDVVWTANSGFVIATPGSLPHFAEAAGMGRVHGIWSVADQGPLNLVAWRAKRVHELDSRWNYAPVLDYAVNRAGWSKWHNARRSRLAYAIGLRSRLLRSEVVRIKSAWGLHLIHRGRMTPLLDNLLP